MRTVVTFLMIVDMMVAQFYSMEACVSMNTRT